jgi:hypothetical protein
VDDFPCESPAATIAPLWIIGPSFPTGKPPDTAQTVPRTLQKKVRMRSMRGIFMPKRTVEEDTVRSKGSKDGFQ